MARRYPREADGKRSALRFNDLIPEVFLYADRKRLVDRPFAAYRELSEEWERYPDGWEDQVLGMLAADAVCGRPDRCAGFVRSIRNRLPDSDVAVARQWRRLPWFWCCFTVTEELDRSVQLVSPLGASPAHWPEDESWDKLIVCSPVISEQVGRGIHTFLCQLACIDGMFHTYGVMLTFSSFDEEDLLAFADAVDAFRAPNDQGRLLAHVPDTDLPVSDIISADPLTFLRLFPYSEIPSVTGRSGVWRRNASCMALPEGPVEDPEFWSRGIAGTGHEVHSSSFDDDSAAIFLDGGSPMYDPSIYLSFFEGMVYLYAMHDDGYHEGREALLPLVSMPEIPEARCSLSVLTATHEILGTVDLLDELLEAHEPAVYSEEEGPWDEEVSGALPSKEEVEAVLERLTYNHNEAIGETDIEVAEALGVASEMVSQLRDTFDSIVAPDAVGSTADGQFPTGGDLAESLSLSPKQLRDLTSKSVPAAEGALALRSMHEFASLDPDAKAGIESVPVMRFHRWLLDEIGGGESIPATQAGYVKPAVVFAAIEAGVIASPFDLARRMSGPSEHIDEDRIARMAEIIRPKREADAHEFHRVRMLLEKAKYLRLKANRFEITAEGRQSLDDPAATYRHLIETVFTRYDWRELYRYEVVPRLCDYAGLLLYALHFNCGGNVAATGDGYRWIAPGTLVNTLSGFFGPFHEVLEDPAESAYDLTPMVRSQIEMGVINFLGVGFGLVETDRIAAEQDEASTRIRPSALFRRVFRT